MSFWWFPWIGAAILLTAIYPSWLVFAGIGVVIGLVVRSVYRLVTQPRKLLHVLRVAAVDFGLAVVAYAGGSLALFLLWQGAEWLSELISNLALPDALFWLPYAPFLLLLVVLPLVAVWRGWRFIRSSRRFQRVAIEAIAIFAFAVFIYTRFEAYAPARIRVTYSVVVDYRSQQNAWSIKSELILPNTTSDSTPSVPQRQARMSAVRGGKGSQSIQVEMRAPSTGPGIALRHLAGCELTGLVPIGPDQHQPCRIDPFQ